MPDSRTPSDFEALRGRALDCMLDSGGPFVWILGDGLRPMWVSPSWLRFSGHSPGDDFETCWRAATHPDDLDRTVESSLAAMRERKPFQIEYRLRRADGSWRWVLAHGLPFTDASDHFAGYVGATQDIHDRRTLEDALRSAQEQQQAILDNVHAAIFTIGVDERYRFVNRAGERVLGRSREEIVGRTVTEVLPEPLNREVGASVRRVLGTGTPEEAETVLPGPGGEPHFLVRRTLVHDHDGVTPLVLSIATDITDLRRDGAVRVEFEHHAAEFRRLESIGLMAGSIAHDFNNLLASVLGNAELALEAMPPDAAAAVAIRRVQDAARRAAGLTREMLVYTGAAPLTWGPIDLSLLAERMRGALAMITGARRPFTFDLAPGLPPIEGDPLQLDQMLINLVTNAREAIGDRDGSVTVRMRSRMVDADDPRRSVPGFTLAPGAHVEIEVRDDGCGMDDETKARAFDPFFSTKFMGRGLGLASVRGIVRAHRGGIELESTPDGGTTLRVLLPAGTPARGRVPAPVTAPPGTPLKSCVLVVETDVTVRELTCSALERAGFEVLRAASGETALELWEQRGADVALVLADLGMPNPGGPRLIERLRRHGGNVPVVLMSGYGAGGTAPGENPVVSAYLEKPYRIADLLALACRFASPRAGPPQRSRNASRNAAP